MVAELRNDLLRLLEVTPSLVIPRNWSPGTSTAAVIVPPPYTHAPPQYSRQDMVSVYQCLLRQAITAKFRKGGAKVWPMGTLTCHDHFSASAT